VDINVFLKHNPYKNCWEYQVTENHEKVVISGFAPTRKHAKEDLLHKINKYFEDNA
jgi:septal ring-binding cell division protein DamX